MDYLGDDIARWKRMDASIKFHIDPVTGYWAQDQEDINLGACEHGYLGCEAGSYCPKHSQEYIGKCSHYWEHYVGFTEVYDFCTYCQAKREPLYDVK